MLAGAAAVALRPELSLSRRELAAVGLLGALTGWTALSALWSSAPSSSVDEPARTLVYVAAAVAVVCLGGGLELLAGLLGGLALLGVYGLARYLFERPSFDRYEGFHLFEPLGYANAFGLAAALGALLALGFARRPAVAALLPLFAAALYLTSSRGAWLALAAGGLASLALDPGRDRTLATALAASPFCAAAVALAGHSNRLAGGGGGRLLALWLVLLAGGTAAAATLSAKLEVRRAGAAAVALGAIVLVVVVSVRGFSVGADREAYWHVAWREYTAHPALGSGAGTFERFWARERTIPVGARDAHNLYVETLAELGPVALALLVTAIALPLLAAARVRHAALAPAATGAFAAYLVQVTLDWDWELPAVTVAALACGLLLLAAEDAPRKPIPRAAALWVASGLALVVFGLVIRATA